MRITLFVIVATLFLSSLFIIPEQTKAFTIHDPIVINGNGEFTLANGVTRGSGTLGDPYIIEGWQIEPYRNHAIAISNTDAYFIIRNVNLTIGPSDCYIFYTMYIGIVLNNVINGRIENTTISSCKSIDVVSSKDNIITANKIEIVFGYMGPSPPPDLAGIAISGSDNITIFDNYIQDSISGSSPRSSAVDIAISHNNTIINNTISVNYSVGINIEASNDNVIAGNIISSNDIPNEPGINIESSKRNLVINNKMMHNGMHISGQTLEYWISNTIDTSNTHNGKPIYYWSNVVGGTVPSDAGQVILSFCNGVLVENTIIEYAYEGMLIAYSSFGTIINNTLANNRLGIYLIYSNNFTIAYNDIEKIGRGISVWWSQDINVTHNIVYTFWEFDQQWGEGINAFRSNKVDITFNLISRTGEGIYLQDSNNSQVICNSIEHTREGLRLWVADNVSTYHNNFIDHWRNHYSGWSTNLFWDNGYPSGGNYWWDYNGTDQYSGPGQNQSGSDDIGDTPYIEGVPNPPYYQEIHDRYPLMYPATCVQPNTPPVASFTPSPLQGDVTTMFEVNASSSWDLEDLTSLLEVRWDWEDDGLWDTNWSTVKTALHQYTSPGNYSIRLEVKDTGGLTNQTTRQVNVTSIPSPEPDYRPVNPNPSTTLTVGLSKIVQLSIDIENIGGPPPDIYVNLAFINQSASLPFNEISIQPILPGNPVGPFTADWLSPVTPGSYAVSAIVDYEDVLFESNEDNNQYTWTIEVVSGPLTAIVIGNPNYTATATYIKSSTPLDFSVEDQSCMGIDYTKYRIDDGNWNDYTGPFFLTSEGEHTVEWYSVDNVGNTEEVNSIVLRVDDTPPATILSFGTPRYTVGGNFITSLTPLTLQVIDDGITPVGLDYTEYQIGGGGWVIYSSQFFLTVEGVHVVQYRSYDLLMNVETTNSIQFIVDDTPPTTTVSVGHPQYGDTDLYVNSNTEIDLTSQDGGVIPVGLDIIEYRIDGGMWRNHIPNIILTGDDGLYTIEYRSKDLLGNTENIHDMAFILDNTPPATTISPTTGDFTTDTLFSFTATDSGCGVSITMYKVDDGTWMNYIVDFTLTEGSHIIYYRSIDNLDNEEPVRSFSVSISAIDHPASSPVYTWLLFLIPIIVAVVLILIIAMLKRKKESESQNKSDESRKEEESKTEN